MAEILSYPNLTGFDTVYYAVRLKEGVIFYHWSNLFDRTWFLYSLIIPLHKIAHLDYTAILKIVPPFLHGLNAAGICYFATRKLKWKTKKSLLASILFSFHIASLRISWDLHKNALGLAILLFTLSIAPDAQKGKRIPCFIILSILTVLSHELAAMALLVITFWATSKDMREGCSDKAFKLFISILPALIIFMVGMCLKVSPVNYTIETNVISANEAPAYPLGISLLMDYLPSSTQGERLNKYFELVTHVLSIFVILYLLWLPFAVTGFFKETSLDMWTALLSIGSFNAVIAPFLTLYLWERWMFILVYPMTFYTTNGLEKTLKAGVKLEKRWMGMPRTIIAATILMGILFIILPPNLSVYGIPTTTSYFPSSMQQNTIPLEDVGGTRECLDWLNTNMKEGSAVIVHNVFFSWAKLQLDSNLTIIYYALNITKAIEIAKKHRFTDVYLIWWCQDIGWYRDIRIPEAFKEAHRSNRIAVYAYAPDRKCLTTTELTHPHLEQNLYTT